MNGERYTQEQLTQLNPKSLSNGIMELECQQNGIEQKEAARKMLEYVRVWRKCAKEMKDSAQMTRSGMVGGEARKVMQTREYIGGPTMQKAAFYALAVSQSNALMGQIVAAPTAGSSGVLPGALLAVADEHKIDDARVAMSIFAASGVGIIIRQRASFAGAQVGCQGEIGSAAAMAAAAVCDLDGGDSKQSFDAASLALKSMLGLVCDPIGGLVEVPCVKRNAAAAVIAINSASLARCGIESVVPFEEVATAMMEIGLQMNPALRETSKGGLAATPTGCRLAKCMQECIWRKNECRR